MRNPDRIGIVLLLVIGFVFLAMIAMYENERGSR